MTARHPRHILPSMDIMSCAAVFRAEGHETAVFDMNLDAPATKVLAERVGSSGCELLMLKPTLVTMQEAISLARNLRPAVRRIVVLGPLAELATKQLLQNGSPVDACLLGDPETAAADLAARRSPQGCRGIALRGAAGIIRHRAELIEDLDRLPIPLHELYLGRGYDFQYPVKLARPIRPGFIMSSRGCPHGCIFCSAVERVSVGKAFRYHSAQRVVREMTLLRQRGVNTIYFLDDSFLHDRGRVLELCRRIRQQKPAVKWACQARPSELDAELAAEMKSAGCTTVGLGMESGSDRVLRFMHKGFTAAEAARGMKAAKQAGLWVVAFVILGAPVETEEDLEATYRRVCALTPELVQAHLYARYKDSPWDGSWEVESKFDYECRASAQMQAKASRFYRRYYFRPAYLFGPAIRQLPYLLANWRIKIPLLFGFAKLLWSRLDHVVPAAASLQRQTNCRRLPATVSRQGLVLINPDYASVAQTSHLALQCYPPLGLAYLAAYQRQCGRKVSIIDAHALRSGTAGTLKRLLADPPGWVGIYVTSFSLPAVRALIEGIRRELDCRIIVGGPHVTHFPECVDTLRADFGVAGDGERSLAALLAGREPSTIPGLVYRLQGALRTNPPEAIKELDSLPFPARDLLPERLYYSPFRSGRITTMIASRGCPCDCVFCALPSKGRYFRRSNESIVEELRGLKQRGFGYIEMQDDLFTANKRLTAELCEEILAADLKIQWGCETRADMVDAELLGVMRRAGCTNIKFGVESGVERIRHEVVGKRISDAAIREAVARCNRLGMETAAYYMFGFPGESIADMQATVAFALGLGSHYAEFHIAIPIPGSRLFEIAVGSGRMPRDAWAHAEHAAGQPSYVPEGTTLMQMESLRGKAYRRFYLNLRRMLRIATATRRPADLVAKWRAGMGVLRTLLGGGKNSKQ